MTKVMGFMFLIVIIILISVCSVTFFDVVFLYLFILFGHFVKVLFCAPL